MKRIVLAGAALALGISAVAIAQPMTADAPMKPGAMHAMMHDRMQGGGMMDDMMHGDDDRRSVGDQSPASLALRGVNDKMHRDMAILLTGDADVDFVRSMIPHHQGAIDMAKVVVAFGEDGEIRALAQAIIAAQEKEIADMRAWLVRKGK